MACNLQILAIKNVFPSRPFNTQSGQCPIMHAKIRHGPLPKKTTVEHSLQALGQFVIGQTLLQMIVDVETKLVSSVATELENENKLTKSNFFPGNIERGKILILE